MDSPPGLRVNTTREVDMGNADLPRFGIKSSPTDRFANAEPSGQYLVLEELEVSHPKRDSLLRRWRIWRPDGEATLSRSFVWHGLPGFRVRVVAAWELRFRFRGGEKHYVHSEPLDQNDFQVESRPIEGPATGIRVYESETWDWIPCAEIHHPVLQDTHWTTDVGGKRRYQSVLPYGQAAPSPWPVLDEYREEGARYREPGTQ